MRKIVFDIETKNIFSDVGTNNPADLDISVLSLYDSESQKYYSFTEEEFGEMWTFFKEADLLITYNGTHFDIPVLQKYCPFDLKNTPHLDVFTEIQDSISLFWEGDTRTTVDALNQPGFRVRADRGSGILQAGTRRSYSGRSLAATSSLVSGRASKNMVGELFWDHSSHLNIDV